MLHLCEFYMLFFVLIIYFLVPQKTPVQANSLETFLGLKLKMAFFRSYT